MVGLDTNVIVRYAMDDDEKQSALATGLFERLTPQQPGYIALTALAEVHWVLRSSYRIARNDAAVFIRSLADAEEIVLERADLVRRALIAVARGSDFADALIAESAREVGCRTTMTFDRVAARNDGFELLS